MQCIKREVLLSLTSRPAAQGYGALAGLFSLPKLHTKLETEKATKANEARSSFIFNDESNEKPSFQEKQLLQSQESLIHIWINILTED